MAMGIDLLIGFIVTYILIAIWKGGEALSNISKSERKAWKSEDEYVPYNLHIEVPDGYTFQCHKWKDDGVFTARIGHKDFKNAYYYRSYTEEECIEQAHRVFERGLSHYL